MSNITFTKGEQKTILRRGIVGLVNKTLRKMNLPIEIRGWLAHKGEVTLKIRFTEEGYLQRLFTGETISNEEYSKDGSLLFEELNKKGLHTEELINILIKTHEKDIGAEGCMKYAVVYGGKHALGMLDRDPRIRKLSKQVYDKKQNVKVNHE